MDGAADSVCTPRAPVSTQPAGVLGLCPTSLPVCVPELLVGCLGCLDVLCAALGESSGSGEAAELLSPLCPSWFLQLRGI